MKERLNKLYSECIADFKSIGFDIKNEEIYGIIAINIARRNAKRYGCCKQEAPDKRYYHYVKRNGKKYKIYDKFYKHNIEISKWVFDLNDEIIKNTIFHELIHCFPNCNNHGSEFKKIAHLINEKLGYNISRLGNKKEDYKNSNIEFFEEKKVYNYKIICKKCNQTFYRQRLNKNFIKKYKCGKCEGNFETIRI